MRKRKIGRPKGSKNKKPIVKDKFISGPLLTVSEFVHLMKELQGIIK